VFKGNLKPDHYLFVDSDDVFARVPAELLLKLGNMKIVLELDVSLGTRLAVADPSQVLSSIEMSGYYLQFPPGIDPKVGND
tara:strand:- start:181 stop:423 length:243 start_codon:yes stop_codon:yes gene_type:complete